MGNAARAISPDQLSFQTKYNTLYLVDNKPSPLTLLSWGLGQESTDIAVRVIYESAWEKRFRHPDPNKDIMVCCSDTGAEWPYEWEWAGIFIEKILKPNGIKVKILVHDTFEYRDYIPEDCLVYGLHAVPPLIEWYSSFGGIPTRARSSCTDRKKIQVIRRYIGSETASRYGLNNRQWLKAAGLPHRVLIGFGAEEGSRVAQSNVKYAENIFPLWENGITRKMSVENIKKLGLGVPQKSGCYCCPHQSIKWYWALKQIYPEKWDRTVQMERKALVKNPKLILAGKLPLEIEIDNWEIRQLKKGSLPDPYSVFEEAYTTRSCWQN